MVDGGGEESLGKRRNFVQLWRGMLRDREEFRGSPRANIRWRGTLRDDIEPNSQNGFSLANEEESDGRYKTNFPPEEEELRGRMNWTIYKTIQESMFDIQEAIKGEFRCPR
ncbi:hypothetical protein KM043_017445 [Ampulex compressa]|nr:hypothetical protein KM043_017445 [Ampulex compressa]